MDEPPASGWTLRVAFAISALVAFGFAIVLAREGCLDAVQTCSDGHGPGIAFLILGLPAYAIGVGCSVVAVWRTAQAGSERAYMLATLSGAGLIGLLALWWYAAP